MNAAGFYSRLFGFALSLLTLVTSAHAAPTQCSDKVDNDGDRRIDALVTVSPDNRESITIGNGDPFAVISAVAAAVTAKKLPFAIPTVPFVRSDGSGWSNAGGGDDLGTFHKPTLNAICLALGYKEYAASSCRDTERSGRYPGGKCNYHSPGDNQLHRFVGSNFTIEGADPKYGKTWVASITCEGRLAACSDFADNDQDGLTDMDDPGCASATDDSEIEHDPGCSSPSDNDESGGVPQCDDGLDNDGDGKIDFGTVACPEAGKNLLENGSFESPSVIGGQLFTEIPGWKSVDEGQKFEVQRGVVAAKDGAQVVELDNFPHGINQALPLSPPADFEVSFFYSPRPGFGQTQSMRVLWNGQEIAVVKSSSDALNWTRYSFRVKGRADRKRNFLAFRSISNTKTPKIAGGNLVDDVRVSLIGDTCVAYDSDCSSLTDETETTQCQDGRDNDSDGVIDAFDPGCWTNPADPKTFDKNRDNEGAATTQCQDKFDNDSDDVIDAQDPGCWTTITDPKSYDRTRNNEKAATTQCQDGIDNDGDGLIDAQRPQIPEAPPLSYDYGCKDHTDNDESDGTSQCQDKVDNDKDGVIDAQDPGCWKDLKDPKTYDKTLNDESRATTQCQDKKDNDGDTLIDLTDPGCSAPTDNDEADGTSQCQDKKDNDGDGLIDLADPGCSGPTDNDETNPLSQCQDKIDNDKDGLIDDKDPGCWKNPSDPTTYDKDRNDESAAGPQCSDGKDNDNDGLIDLKDPGCSSGTDNDESDKTTQCQDKSDNDNDGVTDAADPGCWTNPADPKTYDKTRNDESAATTQCQDKVDNDKDGKTDRDDPGCRTNPRDPATYDKTRNDESVDKGECFDGIDNDDDGLIDEKDPGCNSGDKDKENGEPSRLTVGVECVTDNIDNTKTAYLSYNNTTSEELLVSSSEDQTTLNEFVADKTMASPPKSFKPGSAKGTVIVNFSGASLTWVVRAQGSSLSQAVVNTNTPKCAAVVPLAECRGYSGGIMRVRLGYNNPNTFEQVFNIGAVNGFKPGKIDRGQPNRFFAGMNKSAFEVALDSDNETTTWNINGAKVTISPQLPACPGQCADTPTGAVTGELDKVAADMSELMKQAAELLASAKANKTEAQRNRDRRDAERSKRKAAEYEALAKSLTIQFPAVVKTCPEAPPFCQAVDRGPTLDALRSVYANLRNSVVRTVSRAFWRSESKTKRNTKLVKEAKALEQQGIAGIEKLPRFPVECK
jgi:hypothetical protein